MNAYAAQRLESVAKIAVLFAITFTPAGCKRGDSDGNSTTILPDSGATQEAKSGIVFPPDFECDEPGVPEMLTQAVQACTDQDYEAFRSFWSAREDPITEKEFIRAWRASPEFVLKELRQMKTPDGEIVYAVRALVSLDPNDVPEPERDVVMLIVKESDAWRLKRAPRKLIKMLKKEDEANAAEEVGTNGA